jgi:hypothetical protein
MKNVPFVANLYKIVNLIISLLGHLFKHYRKCRCYPPTFFRVDKGTVRSNYSRSAWKCNHCRSLDITLVDKYMLRFMLLNFYSLLKCSNEVRKSDALNWNLSYHQFALEDGRFYVCQQETTVILFRDQRRALPKIESSGNTAVWRIFSWLLFSPATGKKAFHTCLPPKQL